MRACVRVPSVYFSAAISAAVGRVSFTTVSVFFRADLSKEVTADTDGGILVVLVLVLVVVRW